MSCKYCSAPADESAICSDCACVIEHRFWSLLARRWLTSRPEDWIPDVAAFLEVSEGFSAPPERVRTRGDAVVEP
jgi:hypothetical protein